MQGDEPGSPEAGSASGVPFNSLGTWLRTQREARGVSLREIADASKISLRYLEALERDRFDVLPAPVFTRGFLKEYARVVGLDADEVVNLYLLAADETPPELPPDEPRAASARSSSGPSPLGYGLVLTLAVVLFLGVAVLLSWWAQRRGRESAPAAAAPPPVAAPALATPAPPVERPSPVAPAPPPPAPAAAGPAPAGVVAPAEVAGPAAGTPATTPLRVVLEFSEDCWVEFVVDGRRRTSELRTSGEVLNLEAESSILLTLGNVPGVRVEVDGRPFPLPTDSARVVRDLRIDRDAVARLTGSGPAAP